MRRFLILFVLAAACAAEPPADREFSECADCPLMVGIPGGRFLMGSPAGEPGRFDNEGPRHWVTIKPFALAKTPVTVEDFLRFLKSSGYQPEACDKVLDLHWRSPGRNRAYPPTDTESPQWPATCLSWNDAQAYIAWLNGKLPTARYRLPSEAEWEYAARAGTAAARWWGDEIGRGNANCTGCGSPWDGREIAPVGSFRANPFGLNDMLGNVWQWVEDCWHDTYLGAPADGSPWQEDGCRRRVMRGGSWSSLPVFLRSAARNSADAGGRDFDYSTYAGFRLARNLP
jgi:formylglycine-generating enzyme required for sulfatase activity